MTAPLLGRNLSLFGPMTIGDSTSANNATTFALSSAFSFVSAGSASNTGRAVASPIYTAEAGNLTAVYINVASFTGTWGLTDGKIQVQVYNSTSTFRLPGSQLTGYSAENLTLTSGTTGWYLLTLATPVALSAYTPYYIVVSDSDGGGTNYVTLNICRDSIVANNLTSTPNTTPSAWASNAGGTSQGAATLIMSKINGVMQGGGPFTSIGLISSNTLAIGNAVQFPCAMDLIGIQTTQSVNGLWAGSKICVWKSTSSPSSPDFTTGVLPATVSNDDGIIPLQPYTLLANTLYIVGIIPPSGGIIVPRQLSTNTGFSTYTDLAYLMPNQGNYYKAISNGSTGWTYDTTSMMQLAILVQPSNGGSLRNQGILMGSQY